MSIYVFFFFNMRKSEGYIFFQKNDNEFFKLIVENLKKGEEIKMFGTLGRWQEENLNDFWKNF